MGGARKGVTAPQDNLQVRSTAMGMSILVLNPNESDCFKECKTSAISEVYREVTYPFKQSNTAEAFEDVYFTETWLGEAEMYSACHLTFESDKLPALSGMASYFCRRYGLEYHAGIFSGSIAQGLLWRAQKPGNLAKPKVYIAPSWSWTSLTGQVTMCAPLDPVYLSTIYRTTDNPEQVSMLEDVSFDLTPEGQNPYGRLRGGSMKLTGWLKSARMTRTDEDDQLLMTLRSDGNRFAIFSVDLAEFSPLAGEEQSVECLYVLRDNGMVLVLREAPREGNELPTRYQRIGLAEVDPGCFLSTGRKETIAII